LFLHNQRLLIRNFQDSDLEVFLNYRNDPLVAKETAQAFINEMKDIHVPKQGQWLQLAIELKETGSLIGDVVFCIKEDDIRQATIGFTIASGYWGQGFATEALNTLLDYLFEDINLHRIVADCHTENIGSWKTLEKLGFRREAHFIESLLIDGVYTSEYHYGLLQSEWRASKKA
jgi:RimJ/RimL family protein N-acetyltransferase